MATTTGRTLKAGKRTYFFDVKQTKTWEQYLVLTESRLTGKGQTRERSTLMVFAESLAAFVETLNEVARAVSNEGKQKG